MTDPLPTDDPCASRIRFVLAGTSHPGNIGAAARAIRTMGFDRLALVAPKRFPHADAFALAAGANVVLEEAPVFDTLAAAIADCRFVLGATARRRGVALPELAPRGAARQAREVAQAGGEVAFVFGNERVGLDNDELKLCHAAVAIPSNPDFASLNLAQAVQVLAYELRLGALGASADMDVARPGRDPADRDPPASSGDMEMLFAHLERALVDIDFHKGRAPDIVLRRLRRLFLRAQPDQREVRILHGILSEAQRAAGRK